MCFRMPVVILSANCKYRELHHESLDKTLVVRIPELLSNVATTFYFVSLCLSVLSMRPAMVKVMYFLHFKIEKKFSHFSEGRKPLQKYPAQVNVNG